MRNGKDRSEASVLADAAEGFDLSQSYPYRLVVLAERVSLAIAQVYADRFDLSRAEWRLLAALAPSREMTATELSAYSTLDKMQVSRAVARLEAAGRVERRADAVDRRAKRLRLTKSGRALYSAVWPLVLARERYLLGALDAEEMAGLDRVLDKVRQRADELIARG